MGSDLLRRPLCLTPSVLTPSSNHMHRGCGRAECLLLPRSCGAGGRQEHAGQLSSAPCCAQGQRPPSRCGRLEPDKAAAVRHAVLLRPLPHRVRSLRGWEGKLPGTLGPAAAAAGGWGAVGLPSSPNALAFHLQQQHPGAAPTVATALFP